VKEKADTISVIKREHKLYREVNNMRVRGAPMRHYVGRWQWVYEKDCKKISLVNCLYPSRNSNIWEIYCLEGAVFPDVEWFNTKKDAEGRIEQLLGGKIKKVD